MLALGSKNGEIYLFDITNDENGVKYAPKLLLMPSYDGFSGKVIHAVMAKMPFHLISVISQ